MAFAIGVMGLGLNDFLDLTPFDFIKAKCKYLEYQRDLQKERWEIARWQVFRSTCPPTARIKNGLLRPSDFIEFTWEEKVKKQVVKADQNRVNRLVEKWK